MCEIENVVRVLQYNDVWSAAMIMPQWWRIGFATIFYNIITCISCICIIYSVIIIIISTISTISDDFGIIS